MPPRHRTGTGHRGGARPAGDMKEFDLLLRAGAAAKPATGGLPIRLCAAHSRRAASKADGLSGVVVAAFDAIIAFDTVDAFWLASI